MTQHAVITAGFGTFGSPSLVITEGYSSSVTPFPICISISKSTEYEIAISQSTEYGITITTGGC
jgi:hypothetical protein